MEIICPNIHHPDWKKLVDEVGEPEAYRAFFKAGDIPTVDAAKKILATVPPPPAPPDMRGGPVPGHPGYRYSQTTDTEIAAGVKQVRQIYEERPQAPILENAKAAVDAMGEERIDSILGKPDNGLKPDEQEAMYQELQNRRQDRLNAATDSKEAAELARQIQRTATNYRPSVTESAQGLSMRQQWVNTAAGAQDMLTNNINTQQDAQMGGREGYAGTLKEAGDALRAIDTAAIDKATKDLDRSLQKVRVGKPLWQRYREDAVKRIFNWIEGQSRPPAEKAPVQEFTNRVISVIKDRMKEAELVGEKPKVERPAPAAADLFREAMENKEKYGDVFQSVRDEMVKDAPPEAVEAIDEAMADLGLRPYSKKLLDKAAKEVHGAMRLSAAEVAREHWTNARRINRNLADGFVKAAGLSETDARQVAGDLEKRMNELTKAEKLKALEKLKNRPTSTGPARKALTAMQKAIRLSNLGAMDQADMRDVVAKELKLPQVTPAQMKDIGALADAVETAPNEMMKARAQIELSNKLRVYRGISPVDYLTSIWYMNTLSGPPTWGVILSGNVVNNLTQTAALMASNPRQIPVALKSWVNGIGKGITDLRGIWKTGHGLRDFEGKAPWAPDVLGIVPAKEVLPWWVPGKGLINVNADYLKYVGRAMRILHTVFYHSARDAHQAVGVHNLLRADYQGKQLAQKVRETLAMSPSDFIAARDQATAEGWKGLDHSLRVHDILNRKRDQNLQALGPAGGQIIEGAERFGLEASTIQQPEGIPGVIYYHLARMVGEARVNSVPILKPFLMFLRVPTNLFNLGLNLTPAGAMRSMRGRIRTPGGGEEGPYRQYSSEERHRIFAQSVMGGMLMAGTAALALMQPDDEKEKWFDITATGPTDFRKRQQLEQSGWHNYSIKIGKGGAYHFYGHSPLIIPLGIIGHFVEAMRYHKAKDETIEAQLTAAVANAPKAIFDLPTLSGVSQLMDAVHEGWTPQKIESFLGRMALSAQPYIPGTSLISYLDRIFDPKVYRPPAAAPALGQVPFARRAGEPVKDVLGEPVTRSPMDRFATTPTKDPVRLLLQGKNVFIPTPARDTMIKSPDAPKGRSMTDAEYNDYLGMSGPAIKQRIADELPRLQKANPVEVYDFVHKVAREEHANALKIIRDRATGRSFDPFNP